MTIRIVIPAKAGIPSITMTRINMINSTRVPLLDMILSLSSAVDLISKDVANHQRRTAYIALCIASEMGLAKEAQFNIVVAGLIHDIGALTLKEMAELLKFEFEFENGDPHRHAHLGYLVLRKIKCLAGANPLVRHHHAFWNGGDGAREEHGVPPGSHILHLADRVETLIDEREEILGQSKRICGRIAEHSGRMFMPQAVEAFTRVASRECFWFDVISPSIEAKLSREPMRSAVELDLDDLLSLSAVFCRIIDFRSKFTAAHSSGVAAVACALAAHAGFSDRELIRMRIAGNFHDLGKLAVPEGILDKPSRLSEDEFNVIRCHTYHTFRILEPLLELRDVCEWAAFHHERLDGTGYPFHLTEKNLPMGSRIMSVADIFTALTEDRLYRKKMESAEALKILRGLAKDGALDSNIVSILASNEDEVNSVRTHAQSTANVEYEDFSHGPSKQMGS